MKTVTLNPRKCIACGICAREAPLVFLLNKTDGKAILSDGILKKDNYFRKLWPDEEKHALNAARQCPSRAISVL
jgi:ferredoxin